MTTAPPDPTESPSAPVLSANYYRSTFGSDSAAFHDIIRAADLDLVVPSCPDWTLRELTVHLGGVHRWANRKVRGPTAPGRVPVPVSAPQLADWFAEGAANLQRTLDGVDPDVACMTFDDMGTARFWVRRMAQETVVHRWDAQATVGEPGSIEAALAADGVHEIFDEFIPRDIARGRLDRLPAAVRLELTDAADRSFVAGPNSAPGRPGSPGEQARTGPAATIRGPAEALLLLLWGRISDDDARITITGSPAQARALLAVPLVP